MSNDIERFLIGATRACVKFRDLGAVNCTVCVGYPKVSYGELNEVGAVPIATMP